MESQEESVEVSLQAGDKLNFKYKTTFPRAAQVIAFLTSGEEASRSVAVTPTPNARQLGTFQTYVAPTSPIEAVRDSGAQTYPQKIAALGGFITARDSREQFDSKEVLSLLKRMGDTPRNYARDIRNAEMLGYITREPNGEYFLTSLAIEEIKSQFMNARPAESTKKRKVRKSTKVKPLSGEDGE